MKKLRAAEPEVRIMNGTYKQVSFLVKINRKGFRLTLNLVHPSLMILTRFTKEVNVEYIEYENYACSWGYSRPGYPEGLEEFIAEKAAIYSMTVGEAEACLKDFTAAFNKFKQEMCM